MGVGVGDAEGDAEGDVGSPTAGGSSYVSFGLSEFSNSIGVGGVGDVEGIVESARAGGSNVSSCLLSCCNSNSTGLDSVSVFEDVFAFDGVDVVSSLPSPPLVFLRCKFFNVLLDKFTLLFLLNVLAFFVFFAIICFL